MNYKSRKIKIYNYFISIVAFVSLFPLLTKTENEILKYIEKTTVIILLWDYFLRWLLADKKLKKGKLSYVLYPLTPLALINFISLLPNNKLCILRIVKILEILPYSKGFNYIISVLKKEKSVLMSVFILEGGYIFFSALIMFTFEPYTFNDFFDALYWAVSALTTIGYGDFCPKTDLGRLISVMLSIFGIGVIALPSGIIVAGFVKELNNKK
ncbi:MAG: potassium channel family protein [Lachnospirales bacterium]